MKNIFNRFLNNSSREDDNKMEMKLIGRKIQDLRKENNMTQQGLADILGVTYQAVSNWERGESMPDVLRLKEMSKLFDISLDELLGNEEDVKVVEIASGDRKAKSKEELIASSPYMKPRDLEKELLDLTNINNQESDDESKEKFDFDLKDLITMAPFVSREVLDNLIENILNSNNEVDISKITALGPFVSSSSLKKLLLASKKGKNLDRSILVSLAPFLSKEDLFIIVENQESLSRGTLNQLLPFLGKENIDNIVMGYMNSKEK